MKKISDINLFRAFRSTNYALYFVGRSVSQFGTWMQRTAVIWIIYSITHSAFWVGATIFAEQFPSFLLSMAGGVAADRFDKFRIIKITQVASMIQATLLAVLIVGGYMVIWPILTLSIILGIINAFDVPARQSLIHHVIAEEADLPNALSLTTAMASLAQLLGPALSGIVLNSFGAPVCFLLNAASFAAVIVSLLLMKNLTIHKKKPSDKKVMAQFAEGFTYLKNTPGIGVMIVMLGIVSLFVLPYNTVIPVFAQDIFKGDAATFGYITSFIGVGAVLGTIFIATRKPGANLRILLLIATFIMAIGLICFSQSKYFPLAMLFCVLIGFGTMAQFTVCNIVVQSESTPQIRGRVIGIMLMAIMGIMPLGSLMVGAISEHVGAQATMLGQGIAALVIALAFIKPLAAKSTEVDQPALAVSEPEEIVAEKIV